MPAIALDHVQLAMPAGQEATADKFYRDILGFDIVPKPEPLAQRGGRWYQSGRVQLHLGVEQDFRPARKAHPAIVFDDLDDLLKRLEHNDITVIEGAHLDDRIQLHCHDPFGNRIELLGAAIEPSK